MDFDSRPCSASFLERLLLVGHGVDVALTNKFDGRESHRDHLKLELRVIVLIVRRLVLSNSWGSMWTCSSLYERTRESGPACHDRLGRAAGRYTGTMRTCFGFVLSLEDLDVVSCDALVHKPQKHDLPFKTFALSASKAGGESSVMLDALALEPR